MLKSVVPAAAALAVAFAVPAMARDTTEVGYPDGTLAVHAIAKGDYRAAERVLAPESRADARDPARLINIGFVYARTGRTAEAREALVAARSAPEMMLTLADGREMSSHDIADRALLSLDQRFAAR